MPAFFNLNILYVASVLFVWPICIRYLLGMYYVVDVFILFVKLTPTLIIALRCLRPDDRKIVIVQAVQCTLVPYRFYTSAPISSMYVYQK